MKILTRLAMITALVPLLAGAALAGEKYQAVAVQPVNLATADAGLNGFLAQLREAAMAKDRARLAGSLAKDFFWERDLGGGFDPKAAPARNFESALSLNEAELAPEYKDIGWERLRELLASRSFTASPDHSGALCGPGAARPVDAAGAGRIAARLDTSLEFDWVYVEQGPVGVHQAGNATSPVLAELSWQAVRVLDWGGDSSRNDGPPTSLDWIKVHLPSGREGFVPYGQTVSFLSDRLCYGQDASGQWRIAGYVGGGD